MTETERVIINALQGGFPICEHPYRVVAETLGMTEETLIETLRKLLKEGVLTRFGPLYQAERMGGSLTLAAMQVPEERFEQVAELVNGFPEVAHNYARAHPLNLWFVVATERPERKNEVLTAIEAATGLPIIDLPKLDEYYIGLRLTV